MEAFALPYEEAFAQVMSDSGIAVDPGIVPSQDAVDADLAQMGDWLGSLEADTRAAIDQVTAENAVQAGLADGSVGIVQAIGPLLEAFDAQPEPLSISTTHQMLAAASAQAAEVVAGEGVA
jgi:hypothetical protein